GKYREAMDVKTTVSETTHKLTLKQLEERLEDAREEAARAREEAEEAKELTTVLEKAERQAPLPGFEQKDADEPKGPWERFAATAGAGLSQALSNANEWLPQMMEANRARAQQQQAMMMAQQRGLPPGAQQQRRPVGPQGQPVGP